GGSSASSSNVLAIVADAPTNVTAALQAFPGSVGLSWTAPAASTWPVTDYSIESSSDGGSSWGFVTSTGGPFPSATICCLTVGSSTRWRVTAITGAGWSAPS